MVAPIPSRLTNANSVAAFEGCRRMQPCEAGPPRRLISYLPLHHSPPFVYIQETLM
jgi:long-subunit acyl-CoA synthetase (AMP-forming)